jgi:hypothetical protein
MARTIVGILRKLRETEKINAEITGVLESAKG